MSEREEAIRYLRKKYQFSQKQVCEGICSIATFSRIETGEREYEQILIETLLGRLGRSKSYFEVVLDSEDYQREEMKEKIESAIKEHNAKQAKKYLQIYDDNIHHKHKLHKQYIKYCQAMILKESNIMHSEQQIIDLLEQAICYTRSDYKEKKGFKLFSPIELKILYQLFLYDRVCQDIMEKVLRTIGKIYDNRQKQDVYILAILALLERYREKKNYLNINKIADEVIEMIKEERGHRYLEEVYYFKVEAMFHLYFATSKWKEEEIKKLCQSIYYVSKIEQNIEMEKKIERFCEEKLKCQIIRSEIS